MKKNISKYDDAGLLRLYRESRDAGYLVELYGRYTVLVYGVALKYLKNIPDAQDAVMLLWEDLFTKVLVHEIQNFKAWLYSCVRNYCLMELRKRTGKKRVELDEKFMEFCDDFHLPDIRESSGREEALKGCLEALPEKQRLCVRYFFMEELSYKDIAEVAGFPLKMVKSLIQNGKRNLRICLERKGMR